MFGQALIACGKDKKVLEKKCTCSVKPCAGSTLGKRQKQS